jgi:hypothetical protein
MLLGFGLAGAYWFSVREICQPVSEKTISDLSGLTFHMTDTDCDFIAKEETAKIYVSRKGQGGESLLFSYEPEIGVDPSIKVLNGKTIEITIPHVSSILSQTSKWQGMDVRYQIARVEYTASRSGT